MRQSQLLGILELAVSKADGGRVAGDVACPTLGMCELAVSEADDERDFALALSR